MRCGGIVLTTHDASAQQSAVDAAKANTRQAPTSAEAALAYGRALTRAGREADAIVELAPQDPTPLIRATNACVAAGRLTSAKAFGMRAAADFPDNAGALIAQGDAFLADGESKAARAAYESAKKAKGADIAAIDGKLSRLK